MKIIASIFVFTSKVFRNLLMICYRSLFKSHGSNFKFDPFGEYSFKTIEVGDDVFIGPGAKLLASNSGILLGNKIMFGPNVTILGGDHNSAELGRYMYDVKDKRSENDLPVVIEDDVWVGANATILKGVRISQGSIIAAGAVVTKDVAAYSIVAGIPAKVVAVRFDAGQIIEHENLLKSMSR